MDETQARKLAEAIQGEAWHAGGNHWIVLADRPDGTFRVISVDGESVYPDRKAWERGDDPERWEAYQP